MLVKIFYQLSQEAWYCGDDTCEECSDDFESSGHVLWGCGCAKEIWKLTPFFGDESSLIFLEFMNFLWFLIFSREIDDETLTLEVTIASMM